MSADDDILWTPTETGPAVYRLLDAEGSVLYVGVSSAPNIRIERHRKLGRIPFMRAELTRCHGDMEAHIALEGRLIGLYDPPYNRLKSGGRGRSGILQSDTVFRMSDDDALETFTAMRWPDGITCPHCGHAGKMYWLKAQRRWKCSGCRKVFSVTTGTIFASHKLPLQDIIHAIQVAKMAGGNMCAAVFMRRSGVTYKTALSLTKAVAAYIAQGRQ